MTIKIEKEAILNGLNKAKLAIDSAIDKSRSKFEEARAKRAEEKNMMNMLKKASDSQKREVTKLLTSEANQLIGELDDVLKKLAETNISDNEICRYVKFAIGNLRSVNKE